MTPDQLPPLPSPGIHAGGIYNEAKMHAYGLQCAEAAVERERARCKEIVDAMAALLRTADSPDSLKQYRYYAAHLVDCLALQISPPGK